MNQTGTKIPSYYLAGIAILGWFALGAQLYLIIQNRVVSVTETIIRYFSFFTILTNLIVALCVSSLLPVRYMKRGNFFARTSTLTAITVYIIIVGIVYNVILRFLWKPQGLQYVVDELLHTIIPILFILLWAMYVPKAGLQYKNALPWLIYPLLYIIWTAIHGAISGFYPYPFINVAELGYNKVLVNTGGLLIAFLGLSLFLVAVAKYLSRHFMKTPLIILLFVLLTPSVAYSQNNPALKKKADQLIKGLKNKGDYPNGGNDTLIDLNGDRYKDILIEYYGASGTGLKNRIQVFLFDPFRNKFKESEQLSNLANPTFYFNKKIITGYYVANGGGYATKMKWDHSKFDTLEYIDIEVNNSVKDHPVFTLSSYNYVTKKRQVKTLSVMDLPKEYNYWDYVPLIKKSDSQ